MTLTVLITKLEELRTEYPHLAEEQVAMLPGGGDSVRIVKGVRRYGGSKAAIVIEGYLPPWREQ
jgi:hypothetical protein